MSRARVIPFPKDPVASAEQAGLRYVRNGEPGIRRLRSGKGFRYVAPAGGTVTDTATVQRIRSLVIPPAWTDVWICRSADGHLQAVGRDLKGRKQYRYHPSYRQQRDQTKYGRMLAFGKAIPLIRHRVEQDLKLPGLSRNKVLAAVVKLLESTCMRIGNDEYKHQNESYGLTTLQDHHVDVQGSKMHFNFRGKSGQQQSITLEDPRLAKIVKKVEEIPGYELFQYFDEAGNTCDVTSSDVNNYIREIAGDEFTAKDFRTWGGTGWAALIFEEIGPAESQTDIKKRTVEAIKAVSQKLGNRPATCRKYYVHPAILEAYSDGSLFDVLKSCTGSKREEQCVMQVVTASVSKVMERIEPVSSHPKRLSKSILPQTEVPGKRLTLRRSQ
ncbi:MAG: DNA topoisomerase IB [Bryobacteraceae bacterium]|nr:DNA topoisomerase IB [Bryobacteraceae bacterium]